MKPLLSNLLSRKPAAASESSSKHPDAPRHVDIWFHATEAAHIPAFLQLRRSIAVERPELSCLITSDGTVPQPDGLDPTIAWEALPKENAVEIASFFAHYRPSLCLWAGGWLIVPLIEEADKLGIPLVLLDAQAEGFDPSRWKSRAMAERRAIKLFSTYLARDSEAEAALVRIGAEKDNIFVAGRMQIGVPALPCNDDDLTELAEALHARPTWLAACVRAEELDVILKAHFKASRAAHRLLLILVPDDEDERDAFKQALDEHRFRYTIWPDIDGLADEAAQVLLAEDPFEMGLWFRLSPVSFMGASLVSGFGGHNPYAAANLGSAILYGPNVGKHLSSYTRFAGVGGARIVRDVDTLAASVTQLSAPDRSAQMALAAWEIATEGADVTDRITNLVHDALDHLEVS